MQAWYRFRWIATALQRLAMTAMGSPPEAINRIPYHTVGRIEILNSRRLILPFGVFGRDGTKTYSFGHL